MKHNWPILVAALMLGAAIGYGILRQGDLEDASKVTQEVKSLPPTYSSSAPAPRSLTVAAPATQPVAVQYQSTAPANIPPPLQRPAAAVVPNGAQPAIAPGTDYGMVLSGVRNAISQQFGVAPTPTVNGAAIVGDGVRVEIESVANWSISLYNTNQVAAGVQNDNFKIAVNLVAAQLEMDMTPAAQQTPDNKLILKTRSKLGRVSMTTDPAMGNSVKIQPMQKRYVDPQANPAGQPGAVPPAGALQPKPATIPAPALPKAKPAAPPANPVPPPKAPPAPNDQF